MYASGDAYDLINLTLDENNAVSALTVDASTQPPGRGQLCGEKAFTDQFVGKTGPFALGDGIDAVTNATVTSTAVVGGVNALLPAAAPVEEPAPAAETPVETAAQAEPLTLTVKGFGDADVVINLTLDENNAVSALTVDATGQTPGRGRLYISVAATA